ncbi:MAG: hypothetical protein AB7O24_02925 [Kofleriaceae bacterium]
MRDPVFSTTLMVMAVSIAACRSEPEPPARAADVAVAKPVATPVPVAASGSNAAPERPPFSIASKRVGAITQSVLPEWASEDEEARIKQLVPGYDVVGAPNETEGEGGTFWEVSKAGVKYLTIFGQSSVTVIHSSIKDPKGIGPESTYHELASAYPDVTCRRRGDFLACETAAMEQVEYRFFVKASKRDNAVVPAHDQRITDVEVAM